MKKSDPYELLYPNNEDEIDINHKIKKKQIHPNEPIVPLVPPLEENKAQKNKSEKNEKEGEEEKRGNKILKQLSSELEMNITEEKGKLVEGEKNLDEKKNSENADKSGIAQEIEEYVEKKKLSHGGNDLFDDSEKNAQNQEAKILTEEHKEEEKHIEIEEEKYIPGKIQEMKPQDTYKKQQAAKEVRTVSRLKDLRNFHN